MSLTWIKISLMKTLKTINEISYKNPDFLEVTAETKGIRKS